MKLRVLMWILWPAFLAAGIAEIAVFSVFDPEELLIFGQSHQLPREAVYSIGFFLLWAICTLSSALTLSVLPGKVSDWTERADVDGGQE